MTIKNVTKRASNAVYLLSKAAENLTPLLFKLDDEEDQKSLYETRKLINEAQQELVKILAQDNNVNLGP